ncbi:MAG TPA: serine/threonine-protein kinase [Phycisphaerae bacterium]|nr:serine/threonine-protein kinase [Phycisphaerae bacterium]
MSESSLSNPDPPERPSGKPAEAAPANREPAESETPSHSCSPSPAETLLLDDLRVVFKRQAAPEPRITPPPAACLEGLQFGRYRVLRLLGEGGMAQVYLAEDTRKDRKVAFKILKPQYGSEAGLCARFEREARSMARLRHENVVRILDFPRQGDLQAIVMTYTGGGSVRDRILAARSAGRRLTIDEAVDLILQAAAGVDAAHRIGMVHRDIKPSNLLLDKSGHVKVADFGAIMVMEGATWLTGVGQQIGTPGYMSPEQCRGERVGPQSDVYSLGTTLFELLTGRLPFEVEEASPLAMMLKHISEPAPDPRTIRPEISEGLAGAILRSLAKAPSDRYATAGDFAEVVRTQPATQPPPADEVEAEAGWHMDMAAIRQQLELLPQRAIVCWACRCARRVQHLNPDPRVERALQMAEATMSETDEPHTPQSLTRALSRVRSLRVASLKAAYTDEDVRLAGPAFETARAAAAAASSAAAMCIADTAADAAFAARSAVAALTRAQKPIKSFWEAARQDYHTLIHANLGRQGTIGQPIPPGLFRH